MGAAVTTSVQRGNAGAARLSSRHAAPPRTRRWFEFKMPIPQRAAVVLGISVWVIFFGLWEAAVFFRWVNPLFMPAPHQALGALLRLFSEQNFIVDVGISVYRIVLSFAIACALAIPLGILMGSFRRVDAFFAPLVSAWRYLPAPSFIPLLLMWFGTGDTQKIALLLLGVIWFLITLIADHVKAVRSELIETSLTLGGDRPQVLWTVVIPAAMPNIVVAMRQMLAVSWTYLVIAEIVAATTGIGAMMMRAQRFMRVDDIMAGIIAIGLLGLLFDFAFRAAHRLLFPYLEQYRR